MVEFRLLGPLEVAVLGRSVRVAGARQRKLLAMLLLHVERSVPLSTLIDAVWDVRPPATARRQVQNSISGLRGLLAEGPSGADDPTIFAENEGYGLRLGAAELDVLVFQDRVERARALRLDGQPARAAAELRAALGLWRGEALAGLTGRVFAAAAGRLAEQRLAATEDCIALELELGRHADLIGELTELVTMHRFREHLVGQLMLALYRSGRQTDALAAYRSLRDRLADELGLDPGARLRQLHADILSDRPAAGSQPATAQLPADIAGFAGRGAQLKELDELAGVAMGAAAAVTTCVIAGTAGVGKTTLAVHWSHRIRGLFPDGQLYVNLRGFDPASPPMDPADALRRFLDALGMPAQPVPVDLSALSALYRTLLANRRVLVVLDNARDADQVRPLLPGSASCLVLVTSRNVLAGLIATENARPIVLDLFDRADARQMLAGRLGRDRLAAEPAAAEEITARCAGLPLAIAVASARAATHPAFPLATIARELRAARGVLDPFAGHDPATDVRAVFSWSYQQLSAPAKRMFRLLGLHPGPDFTVWAAGSLAAVSARVARAILTELSDANLISEHMPHRYALHDLLRAYAGELLVEREPEPARLAALHRLLDHCLHTGFAADRMLDRFRDPIVAAPPSAGTLVAPLADHDGAMSWFTAELSTLLAGVERAAEAGLDGHCWRLAWVLAYFLERRGHWLSWLGAQRTALAAARRLADPGGQAQALRSLGRVHVHLGRPEEAMDHLGQAAELFQATGDVAGQARVHFDLCWISTRQSVHTRALHHAEQALALFQTTDNRSGQARAYNNVAWGHNFVGNHDQALAAGEQALDLNRGIGDRYGEADTWDALGHAHLALRHHQESIRCYGRAVALYRELGHRWGEADTLTRLGDAYHAAGAPAAAAGAWRRAVEILDDLGHPDADLVRAKLG